MRELLRTNDAVAISWVDALLSGEGISCLVLDQHTSVLEGSIGIIPRRIMVDADDWRQARRLIAEAGEGALLPPEAP
ncbi:putative signal transducing protein [Radicibacter daui]|uniref:putative signal transducing protein n=1 Tax=Radicibacter daui TaxID=3064829 RepID=UPI004046ACB5